MPNGSFKLHVTETTDDRLAFVGEHGEIARISVEFDRQLRAITQSHVYYATLGNDAYHHWQIAYLTKEVGLAQGRLWDMRGWEYFWGALHPLVVDLAFFVSGSIDIVVPRVVSLVFGAFAVGLATGMSAVHAARLGIACASDSVTRPGTQASYPDRPRALELRAPYSATS
jgi:hypothetical protein